MCGGGGGAGGGGVGDRSQYELCLIHPRII